MCGIVGFLTPRGFDPVEGSAVLGRMVEALRHRGPDESGQWIDAPRGIAFGHRRLSIIDLSPAGWQPMESDTGRFLLSFNGEIYNHLQLRQRLGQLSWRGHSDTETLLAGIERWGLESTLREATGMFALALWDREENTLSLARDRMGEKPLYYGWQGRSFLFASELKALHRHPEFTGTIDRSAVELYVRRGYVPKPRSIFSGICKLVPGALLEIKSSVAEGELPEPQAFWSLDQIIVEGVKHRFDGDPDDAVDELENLLSAAIKQQQMSDVPLGAFLSGGIDSSTVVALMQASSSIPVKTYTIGFEEKCYNEANHARAVAAHLHTEHTELYVSPEDAMVVIPQLPLIYDEPFADISQIPTVLVSRLARQQVTVALSGDGGDELFCGYGRYREYVDKWKQLARLPSPLRSTLQQLLPPSPFSEGVAAQSVDEFYRFMNSQWKGFPQLVRDAAKIDARDKVPDLLGSPQERLMYLDALEYLPDDILVKVDRAAMSASLETRVPLLDHHVVAFAWRLPIEIKFRNGVGKWPLKQILYKYVPEEMVNRPKMGFGVPMEHWLRGPLREWAEELLSENRLRRDGFFDPVPIRKQWEQHLTGKYDRHYGLWTLLMFQAWHEGAKYSLSSTN
jgi:asparagine synthase (glutamine-hydrolysing)